MTSREAGGAFKNMKKESSGKNYPSNENSSSTYAYYKSIADDVITLQILNIIEGNPETSHGKIKVKTGLAAGLVHSFMSRIAKKGWIRAKQVSPKRWLYFMTPEGFLEKSRLTVSYLSHTLHSYRLTQNVMRSFLTVCTEQGVKRIAIIGANDLADIAALNIVSAEGFELAAVLSSNGNGQKIAGKDVLPCERLGEIEFDVACICDPDFRAESFDAGTLPQGKTFYNLYKMIKISGNGGHE